MIFDQSLAPEHPRASNTDDVECFFSVMRDHVGLNFTLKQVQFAWRKVCLEFQKRINEDLPYYYFTSSHDRFYEGPRASFNTPSKKNKTKRLPKGEQCLPDQWKSKFSCSWYSNHQTKVSQAAC